jgi:hypothetical protein
MVERARTIVIRSQAQREMLARCAADPAEARRRGMTVAMAQAALDAHAGGRLPARLGPERANRHGRR